MVDLIGIIMNKNKPLWMRKSENVNNEKCASLNTSLSNEVHEKYNNYEFVCVNKCEPSKLCFVIVVPSIQRRLRASAKDEGGNVPSHALDQHRIRTQHVGQCSSG